MAFTRYSLRVLIKSLVGTEEDVNSIDFLGLKKMCEVIWRQLSQA